MFLRIYNGECVWEILFCIFGKHLMEIYYRHPTKQPVLCFSIFLGDNSLEIYSEINTCDNMIVKH